MTLPMCIPFSEIKISIVDMFRNFINFNVESYRNRKVLKIQNIVNVCKFKTNNRPLVLIFIRFDFWIWVLKL